MADSFSPQKSSNACEFCRSFCSGPGHDETWRSGGRRYRALELLVKQKRLAKTAPIPCIVGEAGGEISAEEDSLAENVHRVVCVLTGHGLKDPQTALEHAGAVVPCDPELGAIERAVLG